MRPRLVSFLVIGAALAGAGVAAPTAGAVTKPPVHQLTVSGEVLEQPRAIVVAGTKCASPASSPVPDGDPIVVSLAPAAPFTVGQIDSSVWRHPWVSDPSWRLHFEGLMWMPTLAQRAFDDGQLRSLDVLVRQAVAFHTQNPDPGTSSYGWDEGTAQRRLEALNCLFALTHDPRLVTPMKADVRVQLGSRYAGPPYAAVHNHGLMANLRLVRAAELLGVQSWKDTALSRMRSEAPLAFTRVGTTWEQSSQYQGVNVGLWSQAANTLAATPGYESTVTAIRAVTAKATRVYGWVTEPDGQVVQIGDSDRAAGVRFTSGPAVFRDDQAGLAAGRWSWTNPTTSYYTVRYGPPRRAHGQQDRGGVTWSTAGVRVLVGPGRFGYDTTTPWPVYQQGAVSHNVAVPATGVLNLRASVAVTASTIQGAAQAWRLQDSLYPQTHVRIVNVKPGTQAMTVSDSYAGAGSFRQYWHLDPAWTLVSAPSNGQRLTFRHPSGRTLTISTTGRLSGVQHGSTRPVAGWNFPKQGSRVANYQITIRSIGPTANTVLTVT